MEDGTLSLPMAVAVLSCQVVDGTYVDSWILHLEVDGLQPHVAVSGGRAHYCFDKQVEAGLVTPSMTPWN